jgi:branched-chain amino acid transport system substrate-binding protein
LPKVATAAIILLAGVLGCHPRPSRVAFGIGLARNARDAVRLAAREINADGGLGGVPLDLVGLDGKPQDDFDPVSVLAVADRFISDSDVVAVVGHSDSASTLTAAGSYNRSGVPQIVTIATNSAITNIGVWTYRLCLSDSVQGPALAEYAVNEWHKRRIGVFFVNDDYGRELAYRFERRARDLGAEIVASVMHRNRLQEDDKSTIRAAVFRLTVGPPPDLVALFQRVAAAEWTVRVIREAGLATDLLGGDDLAQYSLPAIGPELTDGIRVSQFVRLDYGQARTDRFVQAFRRSTGRDPDFGQVLAYDAVYLLRDAVLGGGYSRAGVKGYLDRLIRDRVPVRGVGGTFILGTDHDARRSFYVSELRNGRFNILTALSVH